MTVMQLKEQSDIVTGFAVMGSRRWEPANIQEFNNKINKYKMKVKPAAPHGRLLATETKLNIK